jgi:hypothetical protein
MAVELISVSKGVVVLSLAGQRVGVPLVTSKYGSELSTTGTYAQEEVSLGNMTAYLVPLQNTAQTLTIFMGGNSYNLRVLWNVPASCWVLDIYDASGNPVVLGIALVTGVDLLAQFGYLNFGGQLFAQTDFDTLAVPTFNNLGQNGNLYFVVANQ